MSDPEPRLWRREGVVVVVVLVMVVSGGGGDDDVVMVVVSSGEKVVCVGADGCVLVLSVYSVGTVPTNICLHLPCSRKSPQASCHLFFTLTYSSLLSSHVSVQR